MAAGIFLIPVAKQLFDKATKLASEQITLLWNFRRELNKFKDTVSIVQALLRDAEDKQSLDSQVKNWLENLSDIMYDADDLLDDLATEARRKAVLEAADDGGHRRTTTTTTCWSLVCYVFSSLPQQLWYDLMMAHAIKEIREKLDYITQEKDKFHLEVRTEETLPSRETDSRPPMVVVGRKEDKKNIIELLLNSNSEANISVVSIVGISGVGKTTLAQLIFDDDQVQAHFDVKAWVYVSPSFDVEVILGKMLRSIDRQSQAGSELDDLQDQLREKIKSKRFLFVLDDVWEETSHRWETLGKYLTVGALGSKVLVTTQSTEVAEVGGGALMSETGAHIVEPYHLEGLSEAECWNLLMKKDTKRKIPRDPQVWEIGKQILRKCNGVPLAVSTIAGVLVASDPRTKWPSFLQMGLLSISKGGGEDPTMLALKFSFNHLPSNMKHCFTYCKLFPKGWEFNIQMLVQFWVAQGYTESEDEGLDCFKTLWWRSFFQEVEMDELGSMLTCRMHDLMHELAYSITGEKIMRSSNSTVLKNIPSKSRHLALFEEDDDDDMREEDYGDGLGNVSRVRTLICEKYLSDEEIEQVLNNFVRLRALLITQDDSNSDSDSDESFVMDASTLLNSVDKLKHLRYLRLVGFNLMKRLPDSITNLVNLQVLSLIGGESLEELPRDTMKLVNLKHLELDPEYCQRLTHMPKGIGELKFLQTLSVFVVGKMNSTNGERIGAGLDELKGLNALCGKLTIKGLANADTPRKDIYVLKEKLHLQSLVLDWGRDVDRGVDDVTLLSTHHEGILEMLWPHPNLKNLMIHGGWFYQGVKLCNWLSGLTNLVEFSLKDCERCEYLPPLHHMSSLKKLTIAKCPMLKGINNGGDNCDSSPKNSITDEEDGEWPQFHSLAYLCITDCKKLTRLPTFPTVEDELVVKNASLVPFARTMKMKMRRGVEGGVDCSDEYAYDTNILPSSSSSSALPHPLSNLTKLTLFDIDDDLESLSLPDSSSGLISLQMLAVQNCSRGVKLPGSLCSSISLTIIYVYECGTVEYLPPLHELPSLRKLTIADCMELKGCWWKKQQGNDNDDHYYNFDPSMEEDPEDEEMEKEWPHFPCLSELWIQNCPKLTRMPLFPTVEGELWLCGTSGEALVRTMKMKVVGVAADHQHLDSQQHEHSTTATRPATTASPSSKMLRTATPLSKLTELALSGIDDLESLPEEGLRNLTSLEKLAIAECPRLATLPPAMRHLISLKSLEVEECPLLTQRCRNGEGEDWPNISHISRIQLDDETLQDTDSEGDDD